jgi:8-oxo-dGTP pyrophosphatase MutT (NUDIX family)
LDEDSSVNSYQGKIVRVTLETVKLPDGHLFELERVWHPGGAAAVALDEQGQVCLLRQYRAIASDWIWEVPAGKRDQGEDPGETIRREVREEAGVEARQWTALGSYFSSPGIFDEVIHLYLARELRLGERAPEPHELIEVHWFPLDAALEMADRGEIVDGKTLVALYRTRDLLQHGQ